MMLPIQSPRAAFAAERKLKRRRGKDRCTSGSNIFNTIGAPGPFGERDLDQANIRYRVQACDIAWHLRLGGHITQMVDKI